VRQGAFFHVREVPALVVITSPDMLLTRTEACEVADVDRERFRQWERRGHIERAGLNERGWPVYRALDVAICKRRFQGCGRGERAA
jgi:hypothetical protein